jgi:hypothetical protein
MAASKVYTQAQIDDAIAASYYLLSKEGVNFAKSENYGLNNCSTNNMFRAYIAAFMLQYWHQDAWGNTTAYINYSTLADINIVISWINSKV